MKINISMKKIISYKLDLNLLMKKKGTLKQLLKCLMRNIILYVIRWKISI